MEQSDAADRIAQSALNSIQDILHDLPKQVDQARKLPRDVEDINKLTSQVNTSVKSKNCKSCVSRYRGHKQNQKFGPSDSFESFM
jgi:protein-arginine kinase activator protein McsA